MVKNQVHIGQISDLHIGNTQAPIQGIDTRDQFIRTLDEAKRFDLDLLVLSGDLADNAEPGAYRFIADVMDDYKKDWCFIAGNHDSVEEMSRFFDMQQDQHGDEYYYKRFIGKKTILFLDSSKNTISANQLDWLKKEAEQIKGEFLLFVHHPVCLCNHLFMDSHYALKNMDEVQSVLKTIDNLHYIFSGHYHMDTSVRWLDKDIFVTPSTQMQIDSQSPHFKLKSTTPAWRTLKWDDFSLQTLVHSL